MDRSILSKLQEQEKSLKNAFAQTEMKDLEGKKIMIIDDCPDTIVVARKILNVIPRAMVTSYTDEFEAMQDFMLDRPDLIIIDYYLNKINGEKVSIILKNLSMFDIPIIFMSSDESVSKSLSDNNTSYEMFLKKPIHKVDLLKKVQTYIG